MRSSFLLLALVPLSPCGAQNALKSAREILAVQSQKPVDERTYQREPASKTSPAALWRRDALQSRQSATNTAAQSAALWFALAERRLTIPLENPKTRERRPDWNEVVKALPSPRDWPEILRLSRAKYARAATESSAVHWYFAARLQNDAGQQIGALRALARLATPRFEAFLHKYPLGKELSATKRNYDLERKLREEITPFRALAVLLLESPDFAQQVVGINWQLEIVPRSDEYEQFSVPDLASRVGERAATPLVRKILLSPARLSWYGSGKTVDLARKVWLSDPKYQVRARWTLASAAKDPTLALTMANRFSKLGDNSSEEWEMLQTRSLALSGILAAGKREQASQKVAQWLKTGPRLQRLDFPGDDLGQTRATQLQTLIWAETTLQKYPQLLWFDGYRVLSLRLGQTPRRLQLLKKLVANPSFNTVSVGRRHTLLSALGAAYLDADDAKNGGDTLVRALQISLSKKAGVSELDDEVTSLLRLTRLVPNARWSLVAQQGARAMFAPGDNENDYDVAPKRVRIALRLAEQNQLTLAQSLLVGAFQSDLRARSKNDYESDSSTPRTYLLGLMEIFRRANRPAEMVALLENSRDWGERELTPLLLFDGSNGWDYDVENPESKTRPRLGYLAAWALAKVGRRAPAAQITRAMLERAGGYDAAYRLLCELEGEAARPFLQKLAAADRFEERPLIWQAYLSRRARKWKQAQALATRAIAIDPSDGEQGPGDRLRAYSELGAALRGQGQRAQAEKVETAVGAIRLAERADYLRIAGLTPRAIALYERSLRFFDDAYCTQSRLAVQLVSVGRFAEAGAHFRRAYELMPTSFGRLESHCFGCEGVFGGKEQNSIAREVFLQLERARPNDAKIAYLAGYWRQTAKQEREAARYFLRAVKLDPLYLSAWKQLAAHAEFLTPLESDRATLTLIQLDPRGRHQSYGGSDVSFEVKRDYRGLWEVTRRVLPRRSPLSAAHYALKASRRSDYGGDSSVWWRVQKPADAIAGQPFVSRVANLMG